MSDAFDQAMAGMNSGGGTAPAAPAPASAPTAAPAQAASSDPYGGFIAHASQAYNVDPRLIRAVIQTESSGKPKAVSGQGAIGLMQVEPDTAKGMGYKGDLTDPQTNINAGTQYLSQLLDKYGDPQKALMAYHGGFDQRGWGPLTQAYPGKVAKAYQGLPAQSANSGTPAPAPSAPAQQHQDAFDQAMAGVNAPQQQQPNGPQQETSGLARFGHAAAGLADTVLGMPGQVAQQADYAVRRAFQQSPEQAQAASTKDFGASTRPVGNAFGVTNTAGYQGEATQQAGAAIGEKMNQGVQAVSKATGLPQQDVSNMAQSAAALVPGAAGAVARRAAPIIGEAAAETAANDMARTEPNIPAWQQAKATYGPQGGNPAAAGMRGSMGAAGTSYAEQARAEGLPDAIVNKIATAEQNGTLNPTAAERHIEAGSLPVPVDITEGQATGDVKLLSDEKNMRGQNPEYAQRFNAQNGQLVDNLTAIRDQVSPNVNVPSGAPTGQAIIDAYKEMDEPIRQQIDQQYAQARNADGTSALVDASGAMRNFESQIGATRFNALPSRVQQIFADAKNNSITLPEHFDQSAGATRPMNARDIMDIDQTLSGAIAEAKNPTVAHDIGRLRESILGAPIDPAAGPEAVNAFKVAQANARARFQAMDADPAYKAAINDSVPHGEPSPLADQFVQKYIAGNSGKAATANVQNMMQNLSNDPINRELIASALVDHLRQQAGIDLRTGSGAVSQAGLNKAITNLGDKTRIVLGPQASQTVEKLGNVARYTQEQPPGSYVNNSNTFVAKAAEVGKSLLEGTANKTIGLGVVPVGSMVRQAAAKNAATKAVRRSLEPGAGLQSKGVPLNKLMQNDRGTP